jgi:ankyrin repeat protein
MIWPGAHLSQCNTFGETFLHILCRNGPRTLADIRDFLSILRDLDGAGFPFSKRDYHGRTILHVMFQNSNDNSYIAPCLSEIFNIMKPNLSMKDNTGFSVQEHLEEHFDQATTQYDNLRAVVAPWCKPSYLPLPLIHSQPSLFPNNHEEYFRAWFENNTKPDYISSIDGAGDSPLISLLKHWEQDTSKDLALMQAAEQMVRSGAIIHMRDRDGNTALTVAARRGFRPVVTFLLGKGAIVHSRSYRGVGVLKQIEQALAHAQTAQDENLWAHIWSCQTALVDAGAIINPTERDEWKLPTSECWGG